MSSLYWFEIEPVDTLFFGRGKGMEAGEQHEMETFFPPLPSTIIGALRTATLAQNDISPRDFTEEPDRFVNHGLLGKPDDPGFVLIGPLFTAGGDLLLPGPANWFVDKAALKQERGTVKVEKAMPLKTMDIEIASCAEGLFWILNPESTDYRPLNGFWVTASAITAAQGREKFKLKLCADVSELSQGDAAILPASALYVHEERTGIALDEHRTARKGYLYSTVHIRLKSGISMVFAIDEDPSGSLSKEGILQLGGEQRICRYARRSSVSLPSSSGDLSYALSMIPTDLVPDSVPRACGPIFRAGGWDMMMGFHKPVQGFYPPGSVFSAKLDDPRFMTI